MTARSPTSTIRGLIGDHAADVSDGTLSGSSVGSVANAEVVVPSKNKRYNLSSALEHVLLSAEGAAQG
jgi:hypothetical protein